MFSQPTRMHAIRIAVRHSFCHVFDSVLHSHRNMPLWFVYMQRIKSPRTQLLDEGAVQMLRERSDDGNGNPILAAVGTLQFDGGFGL